MAFRLNSEFKQQSKDHGCQYRNVWFSILLKA